MKQRLKTFEFMGTSPHINTNLTIHIDFLKLRSRIVFNIMHFLNTDFYYTVSGDLYYVSEMNDLQSPGPVINPEFSRNYAAKTHMFFFLCDVMTRLNIMIHSYSHALTFYKAAVRHGYDKRNPINVRSDQKAKARKAVRREKSADYL